MPVSFSIGEKTTAGSLLKHRHVIVFNQTRTPPIQGSVLRKVEMLTYRLNRFRIFRRPTDCNLYRHESPDISTKLNISKHLS